MEFGGTVAPGAPRKPEEPWAPVLDPRRRKTTSSDRPSFRGKDGREDGFFWAIVADDQGHGGADPPIVMFHYTPGRGAVHARRFLENYHGQFVQCPANPVENQIRKIALTRKNALFAGHEVSAENWALLASLIANCKICDVDPVRYLTDTLRALFDGHPKSRIAELMPWSFAV